MAGQDNGYTTDCLLLDYAYFKNNFKIIIIELSKQQALDAGLKAIQQLSFTSYLDWGRIRTMSFIIEKAK